MLDPDAEWVVDSSTFASKGRNTPVDGITLKGHVRSLVQKRLCEVLCWWVKGVTDVHNELKVQPFEEDNDEELKDMRHWARDADAPDWGLQELD